MHKILTVVVISSTLLLASCGSSTVQKADSLEGKKAELATLKGQQDKLAQQITALQAEIDKADPAGVVKEKAKLVTLTPLTPTSFTHYIDLQGSVDAEDISFVAPRNGTGGVVRARYVMKGDPVKKGQLLLKLDDAIQRQTLSNDQTRLAHAKDIYQRRQNLWNQKIGTEVDLINAKNDVDQAENQIKLDQEQLDFTNVYADINGVVDDITVKVGEMFSGGQIRLINTNNLKVVVQVPEIYQERVKVGTPVKVVFPGLGNKELTAVVNVTSKTINTGSRSFEVDIRIPNGSNIRANQVAVVKIQDYSASNALTIPVNTLQTDEKGKYVLVGVTENGKTVAHKKTVTIGQLYADKIEVKSGLTTGDQLITDGFQGLYEGQLITTQ